MGGWEYFVADESIKTDTTTCRPDQIVNGKQHYKCDDFTGIFKGYNPVAIIWNEDYSEWRIIKNNNPNSILDYQYSYEDNQVSVCIDHEGGV